MKSLKARLLTAGIGIPSLIILILIATKFPPILSVIVGVASAFMVGEFLNAKGLLKNYSLSVPCMLFSVAISLLMTTRYIYIAIAVFLILIFTVMITHHERISFIDVAYSITGVSLISFGMSSFAAICSNSKTLAFLFIVVFALPWMADAGGFFVGASLGKHKLCPKISPKKTVEGAFGGVVFCVITSVIVGLIFKLIIIPDANINFFALILIGIIDAPVSILGDLSFSLIKRSLNVKDYGSIFPGHGGMLDRFDSIIFTAPVVVVVNMFLPLITF
ncbi:MAG: phosphatidate cytidylyltransferase [Ruminococcus sp.]|nr:phosphatidate cytidylyltransferase [Ruminococcus sp.]